MCQFLLIGNWYRPTAIDEPSSAKSRSGCVLIYSGWPILCASKLHMVIYLYSTEVTYFFSITVIEIFDSTYGINQGNENFRFSGILGGTNCALKVI